MLTDVPSVFWEDVISKYIGFLKGLVYQGTALSRCSWSWDKLWFIHTKHVAQHRNKPSGHLCLSVSWGYWQEIANKFLATWCLNSAPRSLRQCFLAGILLIFIEVRKWGKVFTELSGERWGRGQFKASLSYKYVRPCLKKRRGIEKGRKGESSLLAPDSEAVWSGETVRSLCTERKREEERGEWRKRCRKNPQIVKKARI